MRGKKKNKQNRSGGSNEGRFPLASVPPSFVMVPWYPITIRIRNPALLVTVGNVHSELASQLQVTFGTQGVICRLHSLRLWSSIAATGSLTAAPPLSALIFDPIAATSASGAVAGTGVRALEVLGAYPDITNRAAIGYRYPKAQRDFSLGCFPANGTILLSLTGVSASSILYLDVLWRPGMLLTSPVTLSTQDTVASISEV